MAWDAVQEGNVLHVLEAYARGADLNLLYETPPAAELFREAHGRIDPPGSKGAATSHDAAACTLLQVACRSGNLAVVESLVQNQGSADKCDALGWSALHYCTAFQQPAAAKLLIRRGASVDV